MMGVSLAIALMTAQKAYKPGILGGSLMTLTSK